MNFVLFFGGLSVLVGSCLIVCVCNQCKRRRMKKKDIPEKNIKRPPSSISIVIEPDTKPHLNGSVQSADFTISPPKQFLPVSNSSMVSKDSFASTRSLLTTKNTLSSSSCLVLPSINEKSDRRRASTHSVIPTIYVTSSSSST